VTLVGLRPAWHRPGIPAEVYAAPSGPVEVFVDGVRYLFIPARFGWPGSAIDGIFPTALVDEEQLALDRGLKETQIDGSAGTELGDVEF